MKNQTINFEDELNIAIEDDLKKSFNFVVNECLNSNTLEHFCRLKGYRLPTSPIDIMIDEATGRLSQIAHEFIEFVNEYVFKPLIIKYIESDV